MLRVFQGFTNLNYEERKEVLLAIKEYQDNVDREARKSMLRTFAQRAGVSLGPTGTGGCPCCGR
jgi:hypothetical protein